MKSRELVTRAIRFERPSRVPLHFRNDPDRSDIVQVDYASLVDWDPSRKGVDEWGCMWDNLIGTGAGQVIEHPIANREDLTHYSLPDPHIGSRFDDIEAAVEKYPDKYIAGSMGLSGFNRMFALRGFEDLLVDLHLSPELVHELADKVFEFEFGIIEEYAKRNVNGVWFFDDWGTEHSLMINPDMWRKVFKPRYQEQFRFVHRKRMDVLFHTCGNVWDIIPDLVEIGVDVLNLEQPLIFGTEASNGIDRLAQNFGGRVCFCTNVDSQRTLISGTLREIEEQVQHIIRALGRPEGGLIALADCGKDHNIVPLENVETMGQAFERYGRDIYLDSSDARPRGKLRRR